MTFALRCKELQARPQSDEPEESEYTCRSCHQSCEAALATQDYVSPIDVLVGIGWLDPGSVERWRRGQIDCLERVVQTNLPRISEAMKLFRSWATGRGLFASPTHYVTRTPRRQTLRFSRSGDPTIEGLYRTRWVSRGRTDPSRAFAA